MTHEWVRPPCKNSGGAQVTTQQRKDTYMHKTCRESDNTKIDNFQKTFKKVFKYLVNLTNVAC